MTTRKEDDRLIRANIAVRDKIISEIDKVLIERGYRPKNKSKTRFAKNNFLHVIFNSTEGSLLSDAEYTLPTVFEAKAKGEIPFEICDMFPTCFQYPDEGNYRWLKRVTLRTSSAKPRVLARQVDRIYDELTAAIEPYKNILIRFH